MDADSLIAKIEDNLNGKTAFLKVTMIVQTKRTKRTVKMESYSVGNEKSFIKILYPGKDKGITFLKVDRSMWQYVPRIERIIKIPASMMLQNWMGSDFTNDDLARESSISRDYYSSLLGEDEDEYEVKLEPKEEAPVVWGGLIMKISKKYLLPTRVEYYDEEGLLVRLLYYKDVKKIGDRYYPFSWIMEPRLEEKQGQKTIIEIDEAVFDGPIDPEYFTKRALKRFSK